MGETSSKLGTLPAQNLEPLLINNLDVGTPPPNKFYFIQLRVSKGLFPGNMIILAN